METFVGFDSAWTDDPKAPGAIAAVCFDDQGRCSFHPPRLVSFDQALALIDMVSDPTGVTLVALDQPTIVPNATSMRPVERGAASLISWLGGGVQPSDTGRIGMFCAASPVWCFLSRLGALEDPEAARTASRGRFVMEVFPAIALASFERSFFGRLAGPRYNAARRKTFRPDHWDQVAEAAERLQIQLVDERIDHTNRAVVTHVVIDAVRQQKALASIAALDGARHDHESIAAPLLRLAYLRDPGYPSRHCFHTASVESGLSSFELGDKKLEIFTYDMTGSEHT